MKKKLSKVRIAEIIDKKEQFYIVEFDGERRNVFTKMLPDLKIGDKVYIHFFFAVEKA